MSTHGGEWHYWSVDLPGLDRAQAEELLGMAERAGISFFGRSFLGTTVDPEQFLTLHLDRPTVETLVRALKAVPSDRSSPEEADQIAAGIREGLQEWLDAMPPE